MLECTSLIVVLLPALVCSAARQALRSLASVLSAGTGAATASSHVSSSALLLLLLLRVSDDADADADVGVFSLARE